MPPWLDWLDWMKWDCIGAGTLGKILGVCFGFCISIVTSHPIQPIRTAPSFHGRVIKIAVSTLLTLAVWVAITRKPVWSAAGIEGDRLLAVVLILTSAAWPISLLWILFSKPIRKNATTKLKVRPQQLVSSLALPLLPSFPPDSPVINAPTLSLV